MGPRSIHEVIDSILKVIPEVEDDSLRDRLNEINQSALYTPPEAMWVWWRELKRTLDIHLGEPGDVEWKKKVSAIVRGESSDSPLKE